MELEAVTDKWLKKIYYHMINESGLGEEYIITLIQMKGKLTLAKVKFSPCRLSLTSGSSPTSAWLGKPFSWLIPSRTFLIPWNFFISYFDPFSFFILLYITPTTSNNKMQIYFYIKDRLQISLLILSEFKRINWLLFPLKSSENLWFSDDFRENRS